MGPYEFTAGSAACRSGRTECQYFFGFDVCRPEYETNIFDLDRRKAGDCAGQQGLKKDPDF